MSGWLKWFPEEYKGYREGNLFDVVCERCHKRMGNHNGTHGDGIFCSRADHDNMNDDGRFVAPSLKPKIKIKLDDSLFEVD